MRILDGSSGIITSYKDEYAVGQDNVIGLNNPGNPDGVADALTDLLHSGARQMLAAAVEAEIQEFVKRHQGLRDGQGGARIVRNGYLPERSIQTGLGNIEVKVPRARDRGGRSNSDRRSCRFICAGRNPSRNCCPGCI